jgi:hypothetical protein
VINNGSVTVDSVGQHAGTIRLATAAGNNAVLNITNGWIKVEDAPVGPGNGEVVIGAGTSATAALNLSGGKLTAKTLSKGDDGTFNFTGGVLSAQTINFDLVNNGGTLAPGESPGMTNINGSFKTTSGTLEIELASAANFDTVVATGAVNLGGDLIVKLLGGFVPNVTDTFTIVTGSDILDSFDNLLPDQRVNIDGADGSFLVTYGDQTVTLSNFSLAPPALAGDYNNDGNVDAADYIVWRKFVDTNFALPNETASLGGVDEDDYNAWLANFGAAGSGDDSPVPEPTTSTFVLVAFLARRRSRDSHWPACSSRG